MPLYVVAPPVYVCDALGPGGGAEFEFGRSGKSRGKIAYISRWISDVSKRERQRERERERENKG